MAWHITDDLDEYATAAGDFLRADPVASTVPLSVIAAGNIRKGLFGWWRPGSEIQGTFIHAGGYPLLLGAMPEHAARNLAGVLVARDAVPADVNGEPGIVRAFTDVLGHPTETKMRQRLYRLTEPAVPRPLPEGRSRAAGPADRDLLVEWFEAFDREHGERPRDAEADVDRRLAYRGVMLWEAGDRPVSVAAHTRMSAGMARIGPVYTPPEQRNHGYGAAVTAAVTRSLLDAGADHVVLFTDLADRTANALYQRIGFRPVSDRLVVTLSGRRPSAPSHDRSGTA
jgi:predicted GNAT family acetyltransferase